MRLEDMSRELDMNDPELNGSIARNSGEIKMSAYSEADIPADGHNIVTSTMDDWEQPNQVVCCEVE